VASDICIRGHADEDSPDLRAGATRDAKAQAVATAKEPYDRLLKGAGRAMVGDSKLAMHDLVDHGEG